MGFFDNHNHSQFSFDGKKTTVEESAAAAFAKGLDGICFTDHCDFYVPPMKAQFEHLVPEVFNVESQQAEIDRVNAASYAALPGNRRFRELGGEAVSLGSDSHDAQRTGDNFLHFADVVRSAGFRYLAHFESRQLRMTPLSCGPGRLEDRLRNGLKECQDTKKEDCNPLFLYP